MTDAGRWTCYVYVLIGIDNDLGYTRFRRGIAEALNTIDMVWVPRNGDRISRYIEKSEAMLTEVTTAQLEELFGAPVSDQGMPERFGGWSRTGCHTA